MKKAHQLPPSTRSERPSTPSSSPSPPGKKQAKPSAHSRRPTEVSREPLALGFNQAPGQDDYTLANEETPCPHRLTRTSSPPDATPGTDGHQSQNSTPDARANHIRAHRIVTIPTEWENALGSITEDSGWPIRPRWWTPDTCAPPRDPERRSPRHMGTITKHRKHKAPSCGGALVFIFSDPPRVRAYWGSVPASSSKK